MRTMQWAGSRMPKAFLMVALGTILLFTTARVSGASDTNATVAWLEKPLSLEAALNLALQQNSAVLRSEKDLEVAHGIAVQSRAIVIPKLQAGSNYQYTEKSGVEMIPFQEDVPNQQWSASIRLVQSIYEGGRITSSLRTAKLTREQALANHQTVIADTLLNVQTAYYDALLAADQIRVQEASVELLSRELEDNRRRFKAGTVPRFNVLRAEVELANAQPKLIRARNASRIAKNTLSNLLGINLPKNAWEDIPLQVSGKLEAIPYDIDLPSAIARSLQNRSEIMALKRSEQLRKEAIVDAKAGYKPSVQLFTGYGSHSPMFMNDLGRDISGWFAGGQLTWNVFDGLRTHGRVQEAQALYDRAKIDVDDTIRRIELEVRTAHSSFVEAKEVLESQQKVQEEAEEALRLAKVRADAGSGTQLDVLSAQTALTEARNTQVQALRDYAVARARLERAVGDIGAQYRKN